MAYFSCSEVKDSKLCWSEVLGYETARISNNNINNNSSNGNSPRNVNDSLPTSTAGVTTMPSDFSSLCRVVNDLNAGFSLLRAQVETVVTNLDSVSKSNQRIHEKVPISASSETSLNLRSKSSVLSRLWQNPEVQCLMKPVSDLEL